MTSACNFELLDGDLSLQVIVESSSLTLRFQKGHDDSREDQKLSSK